MAWKLAEARKLAPDGIPGEETALPLGLLGTTDNFFNELKYQSNNPPGRCYLLANSLQGAACGICSAGQLGVVPACGDNQEAYLPSTSPTRACFVHRSWLSRLGSGRSAVLKADGRV